MINVENEIFNTVATKLRADFPGIFVTGEYTPVPSDWPAVSLVEDDNSTYTATLDSSGAENHAQLLYTANVYSNKVPGKKTECKAIMSMIDREMINMGFLRVGNTPAEVPNTTQSVYRMVARYRAVISKENIIYRK